MKAYCLIREQPNYRAEAFRAGLVARGYKVFNRPDSPKPGDVLVIWNRYGEGDTWARAFEAAGCPVLVAENGPLGREWRAGYWYTLACNFHNGAGAFVDGGPERWDGWNVPLAPWRQDGRHILLLAARGIGVDPIRQAGGWVDQVTLRLKRMTKRPIVARMHPGEGKPPRELAADLENAWCAVTWGSGAALKAILAGIPVFHGFPKWLGAGAALPIGSDIEKPFLGDRLPMLRRIAWCNWNTDEIASGEPFRLLLPDTRQG